MNSDTSLLGLNGHNEQKVITKELYSNRSNFNN